MALTQSQIDALIQNDGESTAINTILSQLNLAIGGLVAVSIPLRGVGTRAGIIGGLSTGLTDGTTGTGATYRTMHNSGPNGCINPTLIYANWGWGASGYFPGTNQITIQAAIEYNGNVYQASFPNGSLSATIDAGATISTNVIGLFIPPNTQYYERTYINVASLGMKWPIGRGASNQIGVGYEGSNYTTGGANVLLTPGALTSPQITYQYAAIAIVGKQLLSGDQRCILALGDSIAAGTGDISPTSQNAAAWTGNTGWIERALMSNISWLSASRGGFKTANAMASIDKLLAVAQYCSSCIDELIVNDIFGSVLTLNAVQAGKLALWVQLNSAGLSVWGVTCTPYTTSSDSWATTANQTLYLAGSGSGGTATGELCRLGYNAWLRAGAPIVGGVAVAVGTAGALTIGVAGHPLAGFIDCAGQAESAPNSGLWSVASVRSVADGAVSASSTTFTSATGAFTSADYGKPINISGAGTAGAVLSTSITIINSSTSIVLANAASTSVTNALTTLGFPTADGLHPHVPITSNIISIVPLGAFK